jgi:Fe-S-cluster containining protein
MMSRPEFFARLRGCAPGLTPAQMYATYEAYLTCPLSPFREGAEALGFDCGRCGNCCRRPWRVEAQLHDILRWLDEGRLDILASLEHRPRKTSCGTADTGLIGQLALKAAGLDGDDLAMTLSIVARSAADEGCYVLPGENGCRYLIDGTITACSIYDTRPEVCRRFPSVE